MRTPGPVRPIGGQGPLHFAKRIAAELLQVGLGHHPSRHGLGHHGRRRHDAGIRALHRGLRGCARLQVDAGQGLVQGGHWFDRRTQKDRLAIGQAALDARRPGWLIVRAPRRRGAGSNRVPANPASPPGQSRPQSRPPLRWGCSLARRPAWHQAACPTGNNSQDRPPPLGPPRRRFRPGCHPRPWRDRWPRSCVPRRPVPPCGPGNPRPPGASLPTASPPARRSPRSTSRSCLWSHPCDPEKPGPAHRPPFARLSRGRSPARSHRAIPGGRTCKRPPDRHARDEAGSERRLPWPSPGRRRRSASVEAPASGSSTGPPRLPTAMAEQDRDRCPGGPAGADAGDDRQLLGLA